MKKTYLIAAALLISLSSISFAKSTIGHVRATQPIDGIVAIVNDDVITQSELNHALTIARLQVAQTGSTSGDDAFQKQVLDQLINKKLQLQIAKTAGIRVTDVMLNKAITHIAEQNQIPVKTLYERVSQEGMSVSDYRDDIREQLALQRLQQQEVISHLTITPLEIANFMKSKIWEDNGLKEYQLNDILIPIADAPSANEVASAKNHADMIVAKLKQGQPLDEINKAEYSQKNSIQVGDLGWRKLPEIPSAFANQVAHMQKKEVVGPIRTANGFHIIQLSDIRSTGAQKKPERKEIQNLLLQRKFEEAMKTWISKLRAQAFIESDAKKLNG